MYDYVVHFNSAEVSDFLNCLSSEFRLKLLTTIDPARVISLMRFHRYVRDSNLEIEKIAIVSGSISEPELSFCPASAKVEILSFEEDSVLFDLNKDWSKSEWKKHHGSYDLVLCEQVLEHVLDPASALQNLATLLKPGGVVHVSVPAINNTHGEPHYFYAGFPRATLEAFAGNAGLEVLECDSWTSDKGSRMYATCDWSPISQSGPINFALRGIWSGRRSLRIVIGIILGRLRNFVTFPFQDLFSPSKKANAVATWMFATKRL